MTSLSGTKPYFFKSLRINLSAARLFLLVWTSTSRTFALGIDGAPQIDHPAIDFQIDLVQMPGRVGVGSAFAQVRCDHRPEMVHPAADGLIVLLSQKVAGHLR